MALFLVNIGLMIAAVAINSFASAGSARGCRTAGRSTWYTDGLEGIPAGRCPEGHVEVVFAVVLLSLLIGVPAAYALARREFPGKRWLMLLFLLPLMVPPITYGIPLATVHVQGAPRGHDLTA